MRSPLSLGARLRTEIVDVAELTSDQHTALADELFAVHEQIFSGLSRSEFTAYVLHDGSTGTRIKVFRSDEGRVVGYCAVHHYARTFGGKPSTIFRFEAGLLPAYRGQASTWFFGFAQPIRYKIQHPTRRVCFLGMLVHPSSYCLLAERYPEIHPSRRRETPPELLDAMAKLADTFNVPAVDSAGLVRSVGWITKQNAAEAELWATSDHPDARFFRETNPGYCTGHGLVTVVPLNFTNLLCAAIRHLVLNALGGLARLSAIRKWR